MDDVEGGSWCGWEDRIRGVQGEGGEVALDGIRGRSDVREEKTRRAAREVELHVGRDRLRSQSDDERDDRG